VQHGRVLPRDALVCVNYVGHLRHAKPVRSAQQIIFLSSLMGTLVNLWAVANETPAFRGSEFQALF
jgi:hypothetical protein